MKKSQDFPTVSLVIPAYNNAETLAQQITQCHTILTTLTPKFEILVCNDGSTDNSVGVLQNLQQRFREIRTLTHPVNLGIAPSIRELYTRARYDYIALFSADGDWNPRDIERLLTVAWQRKVALVIGKRKRKEYTVYRAIVSFLYNFLPTLLFGVSTHDAGSIKVIRRSLIQNITLISKSPFFEAELIIKAVKLGYTLATCPVSYHKRDRRKGLGGKFPVVAASFWDAVRLRFVGI